MKPEHVIERQGRKMVLYAGLLDEAHANGLRSITTELLQAPSPANGDTTIVRAVVEMPSKTTAGVDHFTGIGDANPTNVGRNIIPHCIRMAETRAKARALRDAINAGTVALEELGDLDEAFPQDDARPSHAPGPQRTMPGRPPRPPAAGVGRNDLATPAQVRAVYLIGRDQHSMTESDVDDRSMAAYGRRPTELSKSEASRLIAALKAHPTSASS